MLLLAAALAAAPAPKITFVPNNAQPSWRSSVKCQRVDTFVAGGESRYDGGSVVPRKLTELPAANAYSAVFRTDEHGCLAPIVIRYGTRH